jgi:hypothetical protein
MDKWTGNTQMLNTKVWKRFEKSGLALEALHKKTRDLWKAHRTWFDDIEPWIKKFHALNNSITEVMRQPGINPVQTKERNEIIFAIGDIQKANLPDNQKLVSAHPKMFDEIWDAGKTFEETSAFLSAHYQNEPACLPFLEKAEELLNRATANYTEMENRMSLLRSSFEKQKSLYRQVVE